MTDDGGLSAGARAQRSSRAANGGVWFTEYGTGKIGRIDPVTHAVTEYGAPPELDGSDWITVAVADLEGDSDTAVLGP